MSESALPHGAGTAAVTHRRVLALAFPIVLANLTQPILGAVDTAVAGHLDGAQYLGGVALGGLFFNFVAQQVGGKGGGKPDLAMAGGTNPGALPAALASVQAWVGERA